MKPTAAQGEAIAFAADGMGFYAISETNSSSILYYYEFSDPSLASAPPALVISIGIVFFVLLVSSIVL